MSESTGKGHQVPDSTSLSIRLATEYNEPTVPGTTEIVPSTKELMENTTAPGGRVQHTMALQKQSVCGQASKKNCCYWELSMVAKILHGHDQSDQLEWGSINI